MKKIILLVAFIITQVVNAHSNEKLSKDVNLIGTWIIPTKGSIEVPTTYLNGEVLHQEMLGYFAITFHSDGTFTEEVIFITGKTPIQKSVDCRKGHWQTIDGVLIITQECKNYTFRYATSAKNNLQINENLFSSLY